MSDVKITIWGGRGDRARLRILIDCEVSVQVDRSEIWVKVQVQAPEVKSPNFHLLPAFIVIQSKFSRSDRKSSYFTRFFKTSHNHMSMENRNDSTNSEKEKARLLYITI